MTAPDAAGGRIPPPPATTGALPDPGPHHSWPMVPPIDPPPSDTDLLPDLPRTAADWRAMVDRLVEWFRRAEERVASLIADGWLDYPVVGRILATADKALRRFRPFLEELSTVPFDLIADIENWLLIQRRLESVRDSMHPRAIDREMDYVGEAANRTWEGRFNDAYRSQIGRQYEAVVQAATTAKESAGMLGLCLAAALQRYQAWFILVYWIAAFFLQFLTTKPRIYQDSGQYLLITQLYGSALLADRQAELLIDRATANLGSLVTGRQGLTQPHQHMSGHHGDDGHWPNPFNDRLYMRARLQHGRVELDGGEPLSINETPAAPPPPPPARGPRPRGTD
ncbi:hypothetical protein [Plantactinospora sp. KLBMP9567]|uniref:hypothetical protein n=1 Tax=Plantactinospora sp. KLBMP9567 TaxID=3085900 RepID=UPI00298298EB|nr:hypothetical protein [Plantactinospora sp. KLBMP9567]MDW5327949.1 hypothetical protein [Plantactinospora sp. KLBMP9567]